MFLLHSTKSKQVLSVPSLQKKIPKLFSKSLIFFKWLNELVSKIMEIFLLECFYGNSYLDLTRRSLQPFIGSVYIVV